MRINGIFLILLFLLVLSSTGLGNDRVTYGLSYHVAEGTKPPNLIRSPLPSSTAAARNVGAQNHVVRLECIITPEGKVKDAWITQTAGYGLDAPALEAVTQHWLFEPALDQGRAVGARVGVSIEFHRYEEYLAEPADLDHLRWEGNRLFTENQLRSTLQEKLKTLPTIRNYDVEVVIRDLYHTQGYIQASLKWLPKNVLHMEEGELFRVGKLEILNAPVFPEDYLLSLFELNSGDVADFSKIRTGLDRLQLLYRSVGIFDWSYRSEQRIDDQERRIDLTFTFAESK